MGKIMKHHEEWVVEVEDFTHRMFSNNRWRARIKKLICFYETREKQELDYSFLLPSWGITREEAIQKAVNRADDRMSHETFGRRKETINVLSKKTN
jgi:hypothetical protein